MAFRSRATWLLAAPLLLSLATTADAVAAGPSTADHVRITAPIDDAVRVPLPGNTRSAARRAAAGAAGVEDLGAVAPGRVFEHIQVLLQRSPADEAVVDRFIDALHDPASPDYHRWLTAAEYGARFGTAPADLERITAWLRGQGLVVNAIQPSGMAIDVSGSAAAVARAFGTEIHSITVGGVPHLANLTDPSVPAALAGVVAGPTRLNDFHPRPTYRKHRHFNDGAGDEIITPSDLATIYNFAPAFAKNITGAGQTVALIEDTNLYSTKDWSTFRATFGLSRYSAAKVSTVHPGGSACQNPGVTGDDGEAALDVEWSSAAAPNATILLASCANTDTADGLEAAIAGLLAESAPPKIMSVSYGSCETENGATDNAYWRQLYQQAVAAGISVFASTGDSGPASCDDGTGAPAALGLNVSALASTVYNVAVGGTDFAEVYLNTQSTYWSSTNSSVYGSAKSYIPETPWNDTCAGTLLSRYNGFTTPYGANGFCQSDVDSGNNYYQGVGGGAGGPSNCATGVAPASGAFGGTCKGWPKPSWQGTLYGNPKDGVRDLPDVAMFASDGAAWSHYYAYCFTDPNNGGTACSGTPNNWSGAGGTSFASPIVAGIQALVNQHTGSAWGNPNTVYYQLAATEFGTTGSGAGACNSTLGKSIGSACVFNNITLGDNDQVCTPGSPSCYAPGSGVADGVQSTSVTAYKPAYLAAKGYSLATGIGSVNVYNLLAKWPTAARR